jgi:hypothetical protein
MIGFLHVYLVAKMTFRNANSSTNSSYQSKSMDNFRRIKKGAAIDFPKLEENTHDVTADIKSGRAQVDAEAKEESSILPNAVGVQIIEEKESSSLPKATIAYGKWICERTAANCITQIFTPSSSRIIDQLWCKQFGGRSSGAKTFNCAVFVPFEQQ